MVWSPGTAFQGSLPVGSHRMCLIPKAVHEMLQVNCYQLGNLVKDSGQVSMGCYHVGTLCLAHTQIPPKGKQVFNIKHIIYINNIGAVSHSYQFWEW